MKSSIERKLEYNFDGKVFSLFLFKHLKKKLWLNTCAELLKILAVSDEAGIALVMSTDGRHVFMLGHPEYDRVTLDMEYKRDRDKGLPIDLPVNYYEEDNTSIRPDLMWRAHGNTLYTNWLNYYVYQMTPYILEENDNNDK